MLSQIFLPFVVSGAGMVSAGVLLDYVQNLSLFSAVPETFILVSTLLGLKGNLEMTLASRLSTLSNLGLMDSLKQQFKVIYSNLALIQVQATIVSFIASTIVAFLSSIKKGEFDLLSAMMLCATSISTASVASLALGVTMIFVVILARHFGLNPDNITTPIAASLGDLSTLTFFVLFGTGFLELRNSNSNYTFVVIVISLLAVPFWAFLAGSDRRTFKVLKHGWWPVICAMFISSIGGLILESAVRRFPGIAIYQSVVNGVGGNLVAIQASRISTALHKFGVFGEKSNHNFLSFTRAFFSNDSDSHTARILCSLVVILLYTCQWLVHKMWRHKIDPDNSAIPFLTAFGDLLGTAFLALTFILLFAFEFYTL